MNKFDAFEAVIIQLLTEKEEAMNEICKILHKYNILAFPAKCCKAGQDCRIDNRCLIGDSGLFPCKYLLVKAIDR